MNKVLRQLAIATALVLPDKVTAQEGGYDAYRRASSETFGVELPMSNSICGQDPECVRNIINAFNQAQGHAQIDDMTRQNATLQCNTAYDRSMAQEQMRIETARYNSRGGYIISNEPQIEARRTICLTNAQAAFKRAHLAKSTAFSGSVDRIVNASIRRQAQLNCGR